MKAIKLTFSAVLMVSSQFVFAQTGSWKLAGNSLTGTEKFGSKNNFPINFITNNTTRMTLTNTGSLGIGTTSPEGTLHVLRASAGSATAFPNSLLVVENSSDNFINLLNPAATESGILFGNPLNNQDGAIVYNNPVVKNGMQFNTGGAITRMTLTATGFLGLGTKTPASELHIMHGNDFNSGLRLENYTTGGKSWTIAESSNGYLSLAANGTYKGFFDYVSGSYFTLSDMRAKKDIEQSPDVLEKVMQLQVKKYHFLANRTSDKKHYGMIAQDVEKIFPEVVSHNIGKDQDVYAVNYSAYGVIAIKAIQEQQKKIEQQAQKIQEEEQKVQQQQQEIITLEERIAKLEAAHNNGSISSAGGSNNVLSKEITGAALEQNQPNPFNQSTVIHYHLSQGSAGQINVYDMNGALVKTLKADESGQAIINGNDLRAGTYSYTLISDGKMIAAKKLVLVK